MKVYQTIPQPLSRRCKDMKKPVYVVCVNHDVLEPIIEVFKHKEHADQWVSAYLDKNVLKPDSIYEDINLSDILYYAEYDKIGTVQILKKDVVTDKAVVPEL